MTSPKRQHRIPYVGNNLALVSFLDDALKQLDCHIVRCPAGSSSRILIASGIIYSLLLLDSELPSPTAPELKHYARQLSHREHMPIIIFKKSDELDQLVKTILQLLTTHDQAC